MLAAIVALVAVVALVVGRPFKGKANGQDLEVEVGEAPLSRGRKRKKR